MNASRGHNRKAEIVGSEVREDNYKRLILSWERRVIGISGSLIWSINLMELIFKPYGEFRTFSDVRRVQLAKSTLMTYMLVLLGEF